MHNKNKILNLGCGKTRIPGSIGVEIVFIKDYVDVVHNLDVLPYPFKSNSINEIHQIISKGYSKFAKVKFGIIHVYCPDVKTFIRKQKRRMRDYAYYQKLGARKYLWSKLNKYGFVKFIIFSALWLPTLYQSMVGHIKKPDKSWFFQSLACWLTLCFYETGRIWQKIFFVRKTSRKEWRR